MNKSVFSEMLVIELASVLAGPSVGQFFAELGANVLKVENPETEGDVTRGWRLASEPAETDTPAYFCAANWGKNSISLNLKDATDLNHLYELVKRADVLIASYKPGDAEKLKVDYTTLSKLNPKLIYGHITGYGPQDFRAGYDAVIQAESGFMYLNGEAGGPPVKMPVALMDILTAHQLKEGLLVALLNRERNGVGQLVEVSLLQAAVSALANQATNYLVAGHKPQRIGSEHPNIVPYGKVFQAKNGKELVLAIGDNRQFLRLCEILGAPALAFDVRFKDNNDRVQNREEVNKQLQALIQECELNHLLEKLHKAHVPAGAVNSIPEVFELPQAKEMVLKQGSGTAGVRQVAFKLDKEEWLPLCSPPTFKE